MIILWLRIILIGIVAVLPFQNCGVDYNGQSPNLFADTGSKSDCLSTVVDCGPNAEYLEISIDMKNPTVLKVANAGSDINVDITGRCNTGNYSEHVIRFSVQTTDGTVLLQSDEYMSCTQGLFSFFRNLKGITLTNTTYVLQVQMIGIEDGGSYVNFLSSGKSQIDFRAVIDP